MSSQSGQFHTIDRSACWVIYPPVVSLDSQVTALAGTVDKIESRFGPIDNTNVKQDARIGALIQQQVELNTISNELNKTLSDVNGSIRELNTAIQYLKEDHDTAK